VTLNKKVKNDTLRFQKTLNVNLSAKTRNRSEFQKENCGFLLAYKRKKQKQKKSKK
jgi:hypothetical protein